MPVNPLANGLPRTDERGDSNAATRFERGSEGGGKRDPLASGKPHPILPAGAASNDARDVRDECAKDVTAGRDRQSAAYSREYESMHPDDVPEPIRDEAKRLLSMTIATENGRTFNDRADFGQVLYFLAVLTDAPEWDFLRGG